jgi:phenylalanyl-tRNA synthetase alpha chain
VKQALTDLIAARKEALENVALDARLRSERIDVSLPGRSAERGSVHPLTRGIGAHYDHLRPPGISSC